MILSIRHYPNNSHEHEGSTEYDLNIRHITAIGLVTHTQYSYSLVVRVLGFDKPLLAGH